MEPRDNAMRNLWRGIKNNFTWEKAVVRLAMAWLLTTLLFLIETGTNFNKVTYTTWVNLPMYLCFVVLFFMFFCGLAYFKVFTWVETYGPMILVTIYGFLTMREEVEMTYLLGIVCMLLISICYATYKTKVFMEITNKFTVVAIYVISALAYIGYFGCISIFRYLTYRTPGYDFGIWVQMFHYMKNTFTPLTTCERSQMLNHFAVHFSPIYYLYLPFYMVFSSPITLNILQILTIASGLIPLWFLCRHFKLSKSAQTVFSLVFVLLPAMGCGTFYDLHENCFLVPLLLWLFYFIERDDVRFVVLFSVLTCLVKEDAPMYVACIGLYVLLSKRQPLKGIIMTTAAVAYFVLISIMLKTFGVGVMESRFSNFSTGSELGSIWDLVRNIVTNPGYVLDESFKTDRMEFLLEMIVPLGALPLATKHVSRFILFIPLLLENLASDWPYQHSVFYQYAFGTAAILIYLAILNYTDLTEKSRRFLSSVALCSAIVLIPMCAMQKNYYFSYYDKYYESYVLLNEMVDSIPNEASLTCSAFFLPHMAQRNELYEYEYMDKYITDYVVLDLRWGKVSEAMIAEVEQSGYSVQRRIDKLYVVLQKNDK